MAVDDPDTRTKPPGAPPPITGLSRQSNSDMLEPDESVIMVVKRSFVGLAGIYLTATAALLAILGLLIALSPDSFSSQSPDIPPMLSVIIILGAVLLVLILFAATYIYRQSRLLLTDRSLIQVSQKSLFIKKVSRLSYSNVEDVSAEQRGILASIFGYGTLTVQTAGERDNFIFSLCPKPMMLADRIIEQREKYAQTLEAGG